MLMHGPNPYFVANDANQPVLGASRYKLGGFRLQTPSFAQTLSFVGGSEGLS